MSQIIWDTTINPSTTSGNQLAVRLDNFKDAVVSGISGVSRPSAIKAGGSWVDTSDDGNGIWVLKMYTGTVDIPMLSINKNTGKASIYSSDNTFEIVKISDDVVGPVMKLLKKRVSGGGQTLDGDTLGEIDFRGSRDNGVEVVQAQISVVSTDDVTASASGADLVVKSTVDGTSNLTEAIRVTGGKVGIGGVVAPSEALHVKGHIKSLRESDDSVGSRVIGRKKRLTGTGQVLANDAITRFQSNSTTDASAEVEVANIKTVATENHTATNLGSKVTIQTIDNGTAVLTDKVVIANETTFNTKVNAGEIQATTISVTNLVATNTELGIITEVDDPSIVLNRVGTQALANAAVAGFEVQMSDATNFKLGYDSSLASFVKAGEAGSEVELVNVSSSQALSNKAISNSNINLGTASNTNKLVVSVATRAVANGLTRVAGAIYFITDELSYVGDNGTDLVDLGSGSGGGSFTFSLTGDISPLEYNTKGLRLLGFDHESGAEMYASITVPDTYKAGDLITLRGSKFTSPNSSGNVLFRAVTSLYKLGDDINGALNTHTSTNTELTMSASDVLVSVGGIDLCSGIGEINSVAVAPGDILIIRLHRDFANETSPSVGSAGFVRDCVSVSFKG